MKKAAVLFLISLLFLCSCDNNQTNNAADMTPEEIIDAVYEKFGYKLEQEPVEIVAA